jgi:hypothetical protein
LGAIPNPGVNERNVSSPLMRLALASVKWEENQVPLDSNGTIASKQASMGRQRTSG